jgi:hypothetical protein
MIRLDIGLTFPGTAEKAFEFYSSIFGENVQDLIRFDFDKLLHQARICDAFL